MNNCSNPGIVPIIFKFNFTLETVLLKFLAPPKIPPGPKDLNVQNKLSGIAVRQTPFSFLFISPPTVRSVLGIVSFNLKFNFTLETILLKFLAPQN